MSEACHVQKRRDRSAGMLLLIALVGFALGSLRPIQAAELVFKSGFEAGSTGNNGNVDLTRITGRDESTGYDWVDDLDDHPELGSYRVEYNGGDASQRWARIISEPGNPSNQVLQFAVQEANSSNGNARVQAAFYGHQSDAIRTFYHKQRMFIPDDIQALIDREPGFTFLTIAEFWNNANWIGDSHPFRMALNIVKEPGVGSPLALSLKAQVDLGGSTWQTLWSETSVDFSLPIGEWMTTEIYMHEGDQDHGRALVAVTTAGGDRHVLFDVRNFTHHPDDPTPDGFRRWNPHKLYTNATLTDVVAAAGGVLQIYWDDFELWLHGAPPGVITPVPVIEHVMMSAAVPMSVQFDGSGSYAGNGSPLSYQWDFGDGHSAHGAAVVHEYGLAGVYQVTLTVTDDSDASASASIVIVAEPSRDGLSKIVMATVDASAEQPGNPAIHALDGDMSTRWSAEGIGQTVTLTFDQPSTVDLVRIAFFNGDVRQSMFSIDVSPDGSTWQPYIAGASSGLTSAREPLVGTSGAGMLALRYTGGGNSVNAWNSLVELEVWGSAIPAPARSVRLRTSPAYDVDWSIAPLEGVNAIDAEDHLFEQISPTQPYVFRAAVSAGG